MKKASSLWGSLPEWLAFNSSGHIPLRGTTCVPPVWPQINEKPCSMMGALNYVTIYITRLKAVKTTYFRKKLKRHLG
jgi:hypothetical protein